MAYISIGRIKTALESLRRFHAFFGITFLSMKQSGVHEWEPIRWGPQERELLTKYYSAPGAPPTKPFYIPFGKDVGDAGNWRDSKYSSSTLQRARTTDNFSRAFVHPSKTQWAFAPNYLDVLEEQLPKAGGNPVRIPTVDLVAWLYRDKQLDGSLADIVQEFRAEFGLTDDAEFTRLFDPSVNEDEAQFFYDTAADKDELIQLLGGVPEGPAVDDLSEADLIQALEQFIETTARLSLPPGFIRDFYYAMKAQRFVVLAGRPGTGKTAFAHAFKSALESLFPGSVQEAVVSVGQDYGESDVIGYEKIAGGLAATDLTNKLFLSGRPRDLYVVVLDEMNLSHVDYYLARLLPSIESEATVELPGSSEPYNLPPDAFFIGTINSFLEEQTRVPLSGPVKRRSNVIEVPNVLSQVLQSGDKDQFTGFLRKLLEQSLGRFKRRGDEGLSSVLDRFRITDLERALEADSAVLAPEFRDVLWDLAEACAVEPQTSLTPGVLQDLVDYVALSPALPPLDALDVQIAQKLVPQLAGPSKAAKKVVELVERLRSEAAPFARAQAALKQLLDTEDPGSGLVYFRY
jgi:hypothetical protein